MCDSSIHLEAAVSARVVHMSRDDQLKNLTKHCVHGTVQYFRCVHTELTNKAEFLLWSVVLPSARAQYTSLTNPKWRPLARYHAARQTRLWPSPAKNFRTAKVVPCKRNVQTHKYSAGRKFFQCRMKRTWAATTKHMFNQAYLGLCW